MGHKNDRIDELNSFWLINAFTFPQILIQIAYFKKIKSYKIEPWTWAAIIYLMIVLIRAFGHLDKDSKGSLGFWLII